MKNIRRGTILISYTSVNNYLQNKYGEKVYKLSLNANMTCPNRDGSIGFGGCAFCSEGGSGDFAEKLLSDSTNITKQIEQAKSQVAAKTNCKKFIAYFQAFTNTYGPIDYLRQIFTEAINHPDIVILSIATRCDCLSEEVIDLLSELNQIKPVWIEMGMQSAHNQTLADMNCGYTFEQFQHAVTLLHNKNIEVIAHIILGLPGETHDMMIDSVQKACALPINGIKLQLLHVLKNTKLAIMYEQNPFAIMTMDEYCNLVVECIQLIPKNIVIHRITGDAPRKLLIEPKWSTDKKRVLNTINHLLSQ